MSKECDDLLIPKHLHKEGRDEDQDFLGVEFFYRRVRPEMITTIGQRTKVDPSAFSVKKMSCNRSKYCSGPEDVLYNKDSDKHFTSWGVIALTVDQLRLAECRHTTKPDILYTVIPVHSPSTCIYPHSEAIICENGVRQDDIKPKAVKTLIKSMWADICQVVVMPSEAAHLMPEPTQGHEA